MKKKKHTMFEVYDAGSFWHHLFLCSNVEGQKSWGLNWIRTLTSMILVQWSTS